jgi:hypothetical protein
MMIGDCARIAIGNFNSGGPPANFRHFRSAENFYLKTERPLWQNQGG